MFGAYLDFCYVHLFLSAAALLSAYILCAVPATKLNTISKSNLGQCVSKYDLLAWFEISELEPTGE